MITISNGLSIIRMPLAFLFLFQNIYIRIAAIVLAMITDSIDGYFARKYKSASRFGAFLDPAMDKFFVYFVLVVFFTENRIQLWQVFSMLSRDFALIIYGIYLISSRKWANYEIKAVRWGKITTALQFCVLIVLTMNYFFSWYVYALFIIMGLFALRELIINYTTKTIC